MLGDLTGVVFVADALHAQVGHTHEVTARGAHLMVTIKANRPTLLHQLQTLPWAQVDVGHRTHDRGHDHRETRTSKPSPSTHPAGWASPMQLRPCVSPEPAPSPPRPPGETAYLIVTLPAEAAQPVDLHDWARREWHIENRLHWIRDVILGEDAHRARTGNGPAVAAVLRNTAIGNHRTNGKTNIARATRTANRRPNYLIHAVTNNNPTTQ